MAKINLLPWREEKRRQQTREFGLTLAFVGVLGAGVVFAGMQFAQQKIDYQEARNRYLQKEINQLQKELEEIKELESTKANLLARMDIIQQLQAKRPQVVHTFEQLAKRMPDGVFFKGLAQEQGRLVLEGMADSNARVSTLMRSLDDSGWFKNPTLDVIETSESGVSKFKLYLSQSVALKASQLAASEE